MHRTLNPDNETVIRYCIVITAIAIIFAGAASADEGVTLENLDGDGTEDNPYEISTIMEFQGINQDLDAHYKLSKDIDASDTESWNAGAGFEPIGDGEFGDRTQTPFSGTIDGQDHTISDLTINRVGEHYVAPLGAISGTVKNVNFDRVDIKSHSRWVGGIAGQNNAEIESVSVTGSVIGQDLWTGGLVGRTAEDGTIDQSMANVEVIGGNHVGGLVGENRESTVSKSYAVGEVQGTERVGGLVGWVGNGETRQSYATGYVTGDKRVGGVHGSTDGVTSDGYVTGDVRSDDDTTGTLLGEDEGASVVDFYYNPRTGQDAVGTGDSLGTELTGDQMTGPDAETTMNLDFDHVWTATDEYPILQWQVEDLDLSVSQETIGAGETTDVTVELTLDDGSTVTASKVAEYDVETAVADVTEGTLDARSVGQTELTATVAGVSDSTTIEVQEPPNVEFVDAEFDVEAAVEGTTLEATVTYENTGGPGSETATLRIGDETVATTSVDVDAHDVTTETIAWTAKDSGEVAVDDAVLGELSVVEPGTVTLESITHPQATAKDSSYAIELDLRNDADEPVLETVEHRVDGDVVSEEIVEIDADGSVEPLQYAHDEVGTATHVVELHDFAETGVVEILEPAEFKLRDLDSPDALDEDEEATIAVGVTNVGGGEGEADVELLVDGESVDAQSIVLDPDETETITFDATFDTAGEIDVTVASSDDSLGKVVTVEGGDSEEREEEPTQDDGVPGFGSVVALGALGVVIVFGYVRWHR